MTPEFRAAFELYLNVFRELCAKKHISEQQLGSLALEAEQSPEFLQLSTLMSPSQDARKGIVQGMRGFLLSKFLRNTGIYSTVFNGENLDRETWCDRLDGALHAKSIVNTYLAPLEFFDCDRSEIVFGQAK